MCFLAVLVLYGCTPDMDARHQAALELSDSSQCVLDCAEDYPSLGDDYDACLIDCADAEGWRQSSMFRGPIIDWRRIPGTIGSADRASDEASQLYWDENRHSTIADG
jgi:hypothetical protein